MCDHLLRMLILPMRQGLCRMVDGFIRVNIIRKGNSTHCYG